MRPLDVGRGRPNVQEGKKALKACTIETLVDTIAAEDNVDADTVRDVLLTYRYFTTPEELLNRLLERYPRSAPGLPWVASAGLPCTPFRLEGPT